MTSGKLQLLRNGMKQPPQIFVETGTFHGKTTRLARELFLVVHTVELNPAWYSEAVEQLSPLGITCHLGNSGDIVPKLAKQITAPVFWYLAAHWFSRVPDVAGADVERGLPLWKELEAIAPRKYRDVIVVDDVKSFGTDNPTPEWLVVSLDKIKAYFPKHRAAKIMWDQAVVYR
jgi:hypothetical protein